MSDIDVSRRTLFGTPAVRALLIQVLSFALVFGGGALLDRLPGSWSMIMLTATLQGAIAAAIASRCRMAPWWLPIQFFFPLAVIAVQALHLPSWLFLAAFLLLLGLFWTTFRTQVPFYPSNQEVWAAIAARLSGPVRFVDIGSGFGGLVLHLSSRYAEGSFCGVELAPLPWLTSLLRALLTGSEAKFIRRDYESLDLSNYDVVFAFLSPAAMPSLWCKACREMQPGTLLLSYQFSIPGATPDIIDHPVEGGPALMGWYF